HSPLLSRTAPHRLRPARFPSPEALRFARPSLDCPPFVGTPSSSPAQDNALSRHERGFESRWGRRILNDLGDKWRRELHCGHGGSSILVSFFRRRPWSIA